MRWIYLWLIQLISFGNTNSKLIVGTWVRSIWWSFGEDRVSHDYSSVVVHLRTAFLITPSTSLDLEPKSLNQWSGWIWIEGLDRTPADPQSRFPGPMTRSVAACSQWVGDWSEQWWPWRGQCGSQDWGLTDRRWPPANPVPVHPAPPCYFIQVKVLVTQHALPLLYLHSKSVLEKTLQNYNLTIHYITDMYIHMIGSHEYNCVFIIYAEPMW